MTDDRHWSSNEASRRYFHNASASFFRRSHKQTRQQLFFYFSGFAQTVAQFQRCRRRRFGKVLFFFCRAFNLGPLWPAVKDAWLRASEHNCNCKPTGFSIMKMPSPRGNQRGPVFHELLSRRDARPRGALSLSLPPLQNAPPSLRARAMTALAVCSYINRLRRKSAARLLFPL